MTAYSTIGAYGLAITLRSTKTILVEGSTDKRILSRMILERHLEKDVHKPTCVIDECAIVGPDAKLSGKGSKEKVETIAAALQHMSGRLNWLVDREWEGVDVDNPSDSCPLPRSAWGMRTKGHSIENYCFRAQILCDYLKTCVGAELPPVFFVDLLNRFESILRLAAAYSFATRRLSVITRCQGAVRATDVLWAGARYEVVNSLSTELAARNISVDVVAEVMRELSKTTLQGASHSVLQWVCHGHLGEEMVRACAANLASTVGASPQTIERVERGAKLEKLAHDASCLAALDALAVEPLDDLVEWAQ